MIDIYADGADFQGIIEAAKNPLIKGFTTNPSLMRQAGVVDYLDFAHEVTYHLSKNRPNTNISYEVFSDDLDQMFKQALKLNELEQKYKYDIYVKIPVTNTQGVSTNPVIHALLTAGVKVNITAVFTKEQVLKLLEVVSEVKTPSIISMFAGRIADTCVNPVSIIKECVSYNNYSNVKFLWASTRQVYNFVEAQEAGCDIITMTPDIIKKMSSLINKDLTEYSLDTVKMFYSDAQKSGYVI
jgi:transaldolase